MTDNEIIKALEHCVSSSTSEACDGCPFNENDICEKEYNSTEKYALDLILRQKAEIERLSTSLGEWKISALKKADRVDELEREKSHLIYSSMIGTTRAEAITEFEQRLKDEKFKIQLDVFTYGYLLGEDDIDEIAKELKEGVNNDGV